MSPKLSNSGARNRPPSRFRPTAAKITTALIMAQGLATGASAAMDDMVAVESEIPTELPKLRVEAGRMTTAVASPKFTEPVRDTPQTLIVIPSAVYLQQGATNLSDVLRNTAGITFAAGEGGNANATAGDSFYLRGFDSTNNIFVDGVRDVGAYSRDIFNYDQVEIAKGPAGADIGRGGAAGYINLITKVPHLENFIAGTADFGVDEATSGTRQRTTLDLNEAVPQSPVKGTAFRLNALWQDSDIVGREVANNASWGVAPSLAFGLTTPSRALFTFSHVKQDNLPDYGLPSAYLPGYTGVPPAPSPDWSRFYGSAVDYDHVISDAFMARFELDFTDVKLSNQTRYSANTRESIVTTPGTNAAAYVPATGLLTRSRQGNKRDTDILSNQTNLSGSFATGFITHNLTGGLELTSESAYNPAFTSIVETPIPIQSPNPYGTPAGTPFRSGAYTDVTTKTVAVYAFDTLRFSDHWQANLSLREENYRTNYLSVAAVTNVATTATAKDDLFSWKTGLVFKPVTAGTLYVAHADSFTPPGTDFALSVVPGNQNNPTTNPQETTNLEAGVKWEFFRGKFLTTASVFKMVNDNTVFTDLILGAIPTGKQSVHGIELGATGKITDTWLVIGSFAYLDSKIENGITTGNNLAGAPLPLIPTYSGNLWTSYKLPNALVVGGGIQYVGEVQRRDASVSNAPRSIPGYWLWNVLAAYPVSKNVTLRLNINNVFNESYVASYNNNGARWNPGAPRSYLISADFRF